MPLNPKALDVASALVAGGTFVLGALAVAAAPCGTTALPGWVLHLDVTAMTRHLTAASVFGGLVVVSALVGRSRHAGVAEFAHTTFTHAHHAIVRPAGALARRPPSRAGGR